MASESKTSQSFKMQLRISENPSWKSILLAIKLCYGDLCNRVLMCIVAKSPVKVCSVDQIPKETLAATAIQLIMGYCRDSADDPEYERLVHFEAAKAYLNKVQPGWEKVYLTEAALMARYNLANGIISGYTSQYEPLPEVPVAEPIEEPNTKGTSLATKIEYGAIAAASIAVVAAFVFYARDE